MALVDINDINTHLPTDKLAADGSKETKAALDAERIVKGYLAGVYEPTTLASWAAPASTPQTIRAIAGRLTACVMYRDAFSADTDGESNFAQKLYDEAMAMLTGVRDGSITLDEVVGIEPSQALTTSDFWPNDDSDQKFSKNMEFA